MNKKAFLDPFDIAGRLGYYVISILIIIIIFMFLVILITGTTVKYYKSNYGSSVVNLEDRAFNLIEYVDNVTNQKYTKVIDPSRFIYLQSSELCDSKLDSEFGVKNYGDLKGIKIELLKSNSRTVITSTKTCNFVDGRFDFEKNFPVLYLVNGGFKVGIVRLYLWAP